MPGERAQKPLAAWAAAEGKGALHPGRGRQASGCLNRSPRREKACYIRGEGAQASGCPGRSGGEDTKRRRNRIRAFVEDPKTGTALNTGPAPYRAAGSLSSVDGKAQTPLNGANPVWPEHSECSPHTAMSVCSVPPSPQQD